MVKAAIWPTLVALSLLLGLAAPAAATPVRAAHRGPRGARFPPVPLLMPGHGERLLLRPFDDQGRPRPRARRELSHLLRCPHTKKERPADPRLVPVLYQLGQRFHRPLVISSGYRPELTTVRRSRHLTAAAVDFYVPGVKNEDIVRWLRERFHPLGIGYYPGGAHVHVDVDRQRDAFWVKRGGDHLSLGQRLAR